MTKVNCREIPYSDLLLREEWRKKRVIILKRDSNTCNSCNNDFLNQFDNGFYNNATRTDVGKKNIIVVSSIKGDWRITLMMVIGHRHHTAEPMAAAVTTSISIFKLNRGESQWGIGRTDAVVGAVAVTAWTL